MPCVGARRLTCAQPPPRPRLLRCRRRGALTGCQCPSPVAATTPALALQNAAAAAAGDTHTPPRQSSSGKLHRQGSNSPSKCQHCLLTAHTGGGVCAALLLLAMPAVSRRLTRARPHNPHTRIYEPSTHKHTRERPLELHHVRPVAIPQAEPGRQVALQVRREGGQQCGVHLLDVANVLLQGGNTVRNDQAAAGWRTCQQHRGTPDAAAHALGPASRRRAPCLAANAERT